MKRYMLIDNNGLFLKRNASGDFIPTKIEAMGDTWCSRNKAENVLINCINKNLRNRYSIIEVEENQEKEHNAKPFVVANDNVAKKIGNEVIEENQICSLTADIENFSIFIENAEQRKQNLSSALSDVDQEISDINHYIEFGHKFNAYQGWLAFNMLRNRLKKRRKIKDELIILNQLGECKVNSNMLKKIKHSIESLDDRKYKPRKLKNLFE